MKELYITRLICPWCKKENYFPTESPKTAGLLYDLDEKDINTFVCDACGHESQIVVDIKVIKYEPSSKAAVEGHKLIPEQDVMAQGTMGETYSKPEIKS